MQRVVTVAETGLCVQLGTEETPAEWQSLGDLAGPGAGARAGRIRAISELDDHSQS